MRYICQNKECTAYCTVMDAKDRPLYCPITAERVEFKSFDDPDSFSCDAEYCEGEEDDVNEITINGVQVGAHSVLLDENAVSLCVVLKVTKDRLELYEFGKGMITMSVDDVARTYEPVTYKPYDANQLPALVGTRIDVHESTDPTSPIVRTGAVSAYTSDAVIVDGNRYNRYDLTNLATFADPPRWPVVQLLGKDRKETDD